MSPRRDAAPDDARSTPSSPNRPVAVEHAQEIGTREPLWTRHDVGGRYADHGRKREPGDGHIPDRPVSGPQDVQIEHPRPGSLPGVSKPRRHRATRHRRRGSRTKTGPGSFGCSNPCLTGNAPLRKALKPVAKGVQPAARTRDGEVVEPTLADPSKPLADLPDVVMPAFARNLVDARKSPVDPVGIAIIFCARCSAG